MNKVLKLSILSFFVICFVTIICVLSFGISTKDLKAGKYYLGGNTTARYIELTNDYKIHFSGFNFKLEEQEINLLEMAFEEEFNEEEFFAGYFRIDYHRRSGVVIVFLEKDGKEAPFCFWIDVKLKQRIFYFGSENYELICEASNG